MEKDAPVPRVEIPSPPMMLESSVSRDEPESSRAVGVAVSAPMPGREEVVFLNESLRSWHQIRR